MKRYLVGVGGSAAVALAVVSACAWPATFTLASVSIVLALGGTLTVRHVRADVFAPAFIVAVLVVTYAGVGATFYLTSRYPDDTLLAAMVYLALFVASYVLGFSTRLGDTLGERLPTPLATFAPSRLAFLTVLLPLIGLALFGYLMARAELTSPRALLENLLVFRQAAGAGGLEYVFVLSLFLLEAPFWGWLAGGHVSGIGKPILAGYWLVLVLLNILTGMRGRVYMMVLGVLFVHHCRHRRLTTARAMTIVALFAVPAAAFYVVQGTARSAGTTTDVIGEAAADVDVARAVPATAMRLGDAFEGFVKLLARSSELDLLWGQSFHDALFLPIPRAWMPNKPYSFNSQMLQALFPELHGTFYGEEYSLLGELYMNFHVVGLLLGGAIFGVLVRVVQRYYVVQQANAGFVFIYRPLIGLPMAWMSSGLINSEAHATLILNVALGVVFLALVRVRRPKPSLSTAARPEPSPIGTPSPTGAA